MDEMRLFVQRAAARAASETGAAKLTDHAEEVALILIALSPEQDSIKKKAKQEFRRRHPEVGSVFLIFVLPLVIAILSKWITEWIWNHKTDTRRISLAAMNSLRS